MPKGFQVCKGVRDRVTIHDLSRVPRGTLCVVRTLCRASI